MKKLKDTLNTLIFERNENGLPSLVRLVFSDCRKKSLPYRKVTIRPVKVKGEITFQAEYTYRDKVLHDNLSPEEAFSYIEKSPDVFILDVRTPEEFNRKHLPDAVNIPVDELSGRVDELPENRPLLIYCRSGIRAENAARMLEPLMPGREMLVVKGFIIQQ